jgi:hypothetical protein
MNNGTVSDYVRVHNVDVRGDWWHLGAYLDITDVDGGLHTFWLDPGQCRALHRAGARALGYGHIKRQSRQRENTWKQRVEQESEMLTKLANLLFPKPRVKKPQ